jgi:oligopeptide transport system permease protein
LEDATPTFKVVSGGGASVATLTGTCSFWRYLGYKSCPRYLVGTDDSGRDLLDYSFSGLRTSLLLGLVTFVVNFVFGLVWGAISGYFGGWTDILMERFTDILSGIPWIVVMTLTIILLGQNFFVFALALCLTGWIGTSHLTRTQFYRFKSREYILAARTLGASDKRLIFRHILPNAIGTIITSSVLMIPSVIFSEATISYLNLGLQGMASFGVILSENQKFLQIYPYLIVFPSVIMALMMISFNLFGNGLRDALNPTLKGGEQ